VEVLQYHASAEQYRPRDLPAGSAVRLVMCLE